MGQAIGTTDPALVTFAGHNDADLMRHFVAYYRGIGLSEFHFILHGPWGCDDLRWLEEQPDVTVSRKVVGDFSESEKCRHLNEITQPLRGRWVVLVDVDEFLHLPRPTLQDTIRWLQRLGASQLPAFMLQRHTVNGDLPSVAPGDDLDELFPLFTYDLAEQLGVPEPIWKLKFPLALCSDASMITGGNHRPPDPAISFDVPIRGAVSHFKWRNRLHQSVQIPRFDRSNQHEQDHYRTWLEDGSPLPTLLGRVPSEEELQRLGFLVKPTLQQRRIALTRAAIRNRDIPASHERLAELPLQATVLSSPDSGLVDIANLGNRAGRVALVSFELEGPDTSGGIGSAVAAVAESLQTEGHDVHIVYCPHSPRWVEPAWVEYWEARGATFHFVPRHDETLGFLDFGHHSSLVADRLEQIDPDLVHLIDRDAAGLVALLRRSSGRSLQDTRFVTTVHAPPSWPSGDPSTLDARTAEIDGKLRVLFSHSDAVVYPSHHMADFVHTNIGPTPEFEAVIPNILSGLKRSFWTVEPSPKTVDEIVFLGRFENSKGLVSFAEAVEVLYADPTCPPFAISLMGRIDTGSIDEVLDLFPSLPKDRVGINTHTTSLEVANHLRCRNTIVVSPSRRDNLPYVVYECLDAGIPILASSVGGIPELVLAQDHEQALVAGETSTLVPALRDALSHGAIPSRLSFDPVGAELAQLALHMGLIERARTVKAPTPGVTQRASARIALFKLESLPNWDRRAKRAYWDLRRAASPTIQRVKRLMKSRT